MSGRWVKNRAVRPRIKEAPIGAQKAFYKAALDGVEILWDRERPRNKKFVKATMRPQPRYDEARGFGE